MIIIRASPNSYTIKWWARGSSYDHLKEILSSISVGLCFSRNQLQSFQSLNRIDPIYPIYFMAIPKEFTERMPSANYCARTAIRMKRSQAITLQSFIAGFLVLFLTINYSQRVKQPQYRLSPKDQKLSYYEITTIPCIKLKWSYLRTSFLLAFAALANSYICLKIGSSLASLGKICRCLCGCDAPESSPPLKNKIPSKAWQASAELTISPCDIFSFWDQNSRVTTSRCFSKTLNRLKRSRCRSPIVLITSYFLCY